MHVNTALEAALEAGRAVMDIYDTDFKVVEKSDHSPLTQADQTAHSIISSHLGSTGIPILSEEGSDIPYAKRSSWDRLWIVDPLDGTKEFIKKNGEFTINIALVHDQIPILGVILIPAKGTLYLASPEHGALYCPEVEMTKSTSVPDLLERTQSIPVSGDASRIFTIVGSRSHPSPELEAYVQDKERELGHVSFVSAGSSLKFCLVADGQADVYPRLGPTMEWDTAAGQAIAQAAGRRVRIWDTDSPLIYNKQDLHNPWFVVE